MSSSSIEGLHRLRQFYLEECKKLESLPTNILKTLKSLERLSLENCSRLRNLTGTTSSTPPYNVKGPGRDFSGSFVIDKLFGFHRADVGWRKKLEFVPNWVYNLSSLLFLSRHRHIGLCFKLEHLRIKLFSLFSLRELFLYGCNIVEIPEWLGLLSSLGLLNLGGNHFENLPSSIKLLHRLERLEITNCKKLQSLPQLPLSIKVLNARGCTSLEKISSSRSGFALRHLICNSNANKEKKFVFTKCWKLQLSDLSNFFYRIEESTVCIYL